MSKLRLNDGNLIPLLAFGAGTALRTSVPSEDVDRATVDLIKSAIRAGYRHLDTAEMYNTEREVGTAIRESVADGVVKREDLFVTTKISSNMTEARTAIDVSLEKMALEYVDLYLLHAPYWTKSPSDLQNAWAAMESVKESGKARSIGVSNYEESHVVATLATARIPPSINQIEFHPYLSHGELLPLLRERGNVATSAYGALAPVTRNNPGPLDETLKALAKKYGVGTELICLRWCIDQDVVVITTSRKEQRMAEYLHVFDFKLTEEEVQEIGKTGMQCLKEEYVPRIIHYMRSLNKEAGSGVTN